MKIPLTLPNCPVCGDTLIAFAHAVSEDSEEYGQKAVVQTLTFNCKCVLRRHSRVTFGNPLKPYDQWSSWEFPTQCSKAQEIALKLLAEKPVAPPEQF